MMPNHFPFAHDNKSVAFCCRIRDAMVRFCGVDEATADRMMRDYWGDVADVADDPLFFGEPAYYYAMCVAHHPTIGDNDPEWYRRPELWPPPSGWTT
tara:strand:+ start:77197 stop:77487 length:291 start_codon:yes stop_codon:yes gene_type:complete